MPARRTKSPNQWALITSVVPPLTPVETRKKSPYGVNKVESEKRSKGQHCNYQLYEPCTRCRWGLWLRRSTDLAAHNVFTANARLCQHVLISILRLLAVHFTVNEWMIRLWLCVMQPAVHHDKRLAASASKPNRLLKKTTDSRIWHQRWHQ